MMFSVFPLDAIRRFIEKYIADVGAPPKLLVVSNMDFIGYGATCTIQQYKQLHDIAPDLEITTGDYLDQGEFDLALGVKDDD